MMLDDAKARLQALGYEMQTGDEASLSLAVLKVMQYIKNECNVPAVPDGLEGAAVDMAVSEFLQVKKTFHPDSITGLDLDAAVKQIQTGDTSVTFANGEGSLTAEQRLDAYLQYLRTSGREALSCYRRIRW